MRCNWWRWLWGIIPLLVLSWVAVQAEQGRIEADLRARATLALTHGGMGWATARFEGRDATLRGRPGDEAEPQKAADLLRRRLGRAGRSTTGSISPPRRRNTPGPRPPRQPHPHHGPCPQPGHAQDHPERGQGQLPGLRGARPHGDHARRALRRHVARRRGLRAEAARRPEAWRRPPRRARHVDRRARPRTLPPIAPSSRRSPTTCPRASSLTDDLVTAPVVSPFTWSAQLADGRLVLSGYVPSEAARAELLAAAKASVTSATVVDQMQPGDGAPQGWSRGCGSEHARAGADVRPAPRR